jgi:hypothetical protein
MSDTMAILKERVAKAEAKVARAEKALESAKNELSDLQTTFRVMSEISGESPTPVSVSSAAMAERQKIITRILPIGRENGQAPAEIFEAYKLVGLERITIDTFRTTIWRMKNNPFQTDKDTWYVEGDNGVYWKTPATFNTQARLADSQGHQPPVPPLPIQGFSNFDEDDDTPF